MSLAGFHPLVGRWFSECIGTPTAAQLRGWSAIRAGQHTLIAAPTGSGKTLAAFLTAIDALTRREGEDYEAFVRRAGANPIARRVKIADVTDNSDMTRIAEPSQRDYERLEKYQRAMEILSTEAMSAT